MSLSVGTQLRQKAADGRLTEADVAASWRSMLDGPGITKEEVALQSEAFRRIYAGDAFVDGKTPFPAYDKTVTATAGELQAQLELDFEYRGAVTEDRIRLWQGLITVEGEKKHGNGL